MSHSASISYSTTRIGNARQWHGRALARLSWLYSTDDVWLMAVRRGILRWREKQLEDVSA